MMVIDNKYDFGDIVYLLTDKEQLPRIIRGIEIFKAGELLYAVNCGTQESRHYEFELSLEKNIVLSSS